MKFYPKIFWAKLKDLFQPPAELDFDQMTQEISDTTGIDIDVVNMILDAETEYMIKMGIIVAD
jgi:hypothetical protein